MDKVTEEGTSNVIEVSFSSQSEQLSQEIENLMDTYLEEELDNDPLEELLNEFSEQEETATNLKNDGSLFQFDEQQFKLSYHDNPILMGDTLIKQTQVLQEDLKRLSYYLDEMNVEC